MGRVEQQGTYGGAEASATMGRDEAFPKSKMKRWRRMRLRRMRMMDEGTRQEAEQRHRPNRS